MPTNTADQEWVKLLADIYSQGENYAPRGIPVKEILSNTTVVDMHYPVVTIDERNMGYKFLAAEAAWILNGDNRIRNIEKYSKFIWEFSDDGEFYNGAYGPMIIDQLTYACDVLEEDRDTRQSVISIWRPNPRPSRDISCTTQLQFMIRDNKLHCFDTMRSSDAWLGWVYDVFNMTMISGYILLLLRDRARRRNEEYRFKDVSLGNLYLTAASHHIYEKDFKNVEKVLSLGADAQPGFSYAPFTPYSFENANELILHLQDLADSRHNVKNSFLKELGTK
jgi:thymidylate synthase